jgi:hypothetical protein
MADTGKLRIGFIGTGNIARGGHLRHLSGWDDVDLVAFCDIDEGAAGRPAILWSASTAEQRQAQAPMPWLWSLVVGYDDDAGTVTVRHSHTGEFTIRWDELGHADTSNWFCVMIVDAPGEPMDELAANRQTLEIALEASRGEHPGGCRNLPPMAWQRTRCGSPRLREAPRRDRTSYITPRT